MSAFLCWKEEPSVSSSLKQEPPDSFLFLIYFHKGEPLHISHVAVWGQAPFGRRFSSLWLVTVPVSVTLWPLEDVVSLG